MGASMGVQEITGVGPAPSPLGWGASDP